MIFCVHTRSFFSSGRKKRKKNKWILGQSTIQYYIYIHSAFVHIHFIILPFFSREKELIIRTKNTTNAELERYMQEWVRWTGDKIRALQNRK